MAERFRRLFHRRFVARAAPPLPPPVPDADDISDEGDEDDEDFIPEIEPVPNDRLIQRLMVLRDPTRRLGSISRTLLDLICEDLPCASTISGCEAKNCKCIVERCRSHAEEVHFQSPSTARTPLHVAALQCCCVHVIREITEAAVLGNAQSDMDSTGATPLILFFKGLARRHVPEGQALEIVVMLLGPYPLRVSAASDQEGFTALHTACSVPERMIPPSLIQRLLTANELLSVSHTISTAETALHLHCQRPNASVQVAQVLLTVANSQSVRSRRRITIITLPFNDGSGFNPCHYAALQNNGDMVKYLLQALDEQQRGSIARTRTTFQNWTPLQILCQHNHPSLPAVEALLEADSSVLSFHDHVHHSTPLHTLLRNKNVDESVLRALLRARPASLKEANGDQYLPLHTAVEAGVKFEIVRLLVEAYPEAVKAGTRARGTALSLACEANKSAETVQLLLERYPEGLLLPNKYGFLPLHCLCRAYQPQCSILRVLLNAEPPLVAAQMTEAGDCAIHLASSGTNVSVSVLKALSEALGDDIEAEVDQGTVVATGKVENTGLHHACMNWSTESPNIEPSIMSHPEWISVMNNAGFTPVELLCRNGRFDEATINLFAHVGGLAVFSVVDATGNTPLHSAMRPEVDVEALTALIRVCPEAIHKKNMYDDTPLHFACLRRLKADAVRVVALASCAGFETALSHGNERSSPLLHPNTAGQTPIGIAMEEYEKAAYCIHGIHGSNPSPQSQVLETLVKILHYGPLDECGALSTEAASQRKSLVVACLELHRIDVRLDPSFIRLAIYRYPEQLSIPDKNGNYPLHTEASLPIEKMLLLDKTHGICCTGRCHERLGVLRLLFGIYPDAAKKVNDEGEFPLSLMVQNGRPWDSTFALVLETYPEALHGVRHIDDKLLPDILWRMSTLVGHSTVFRFLKSTPR